jgi:hypothetical protein
MRAQHGDVISYGPGVGRPGANVDHGDTLKAGFDEIEGRHLGHLGFFFSDVGPVA